MLLSNLNYLSRDSVWLRLHHGYETPCLLSDAQQLIGEVDAVDQLKDEETDSTSIDQLIGGREETLADVVGGQAGHSQPIGHLAHTVYS